MAERELRAAVIGAGWYAAQNHIPVLAARPDVALDGVCRKGAEELDRVRAHFGFAFASEDHREVLARRPDIVVVASPHHLHFEHARNALAAGAHVLCEKPFTLDPAEAWERVRLAQARTPPLHCQRLQLPAAGGRGRRPHRGRAPRRDRACDGHLHLGDPRRLRGRARPHNRQTAFFRPDRATWQNPGQGGGFAYGQLSHSLALMLYLTGLAPDRVSAAAFGHEAVDLADAAALRIRGGAVVAISGAAAMPQGNRGLTRLFLTGTRGLLTAEFDRDFCEFRGFDGSTERFELAEGAWVYNCRGPVDALVELALGGGRNQSPGVIGAHATAIIAAMLASTAAGGAPKAVMGPA